MKIARHRVQILWDVRELYGALFKRIMNSGGSLPEFLGSAGPRSEPAGALGCVPVARSEADFEPALEKLFGEYMGVDPRKGFAFRWIPNHLKDGHRRIYPRPLLRLVEEAVELERPFLVPADRKEVLRSLTIAWPPDGDRPPSAEPVDILDDLTDLGIVQVRRDGRVDVGDLYLRGLRLKRRGGVARPRGVGST